MLGRGTFKTLLAASALALMAGGASAKTVLPYSYGECAPETALKVSNTTDCEILDGRSQDFINPDPTVNLPPGFFLEDEWAFVGKVGLEGFLVGTSGSGSIGSFNLSSVITDLGEKVLIVFKGGDNDLIGYLVDDVMKLISWSTPFTSPPFTLDGGSTSQNVSHISVYTVGVAPIPLPAAGFLLIGALGGLAAVRRRRRAV
jgi:hypothetical protein